MPAKIGVVGSAVVALIVGILITVLVFNWLGFNFEEDSLDRGTSYGEIYVDSPEVYTRERLVNDRFREDAWLRKALEQMSVFKQRIQGDIRAAERQELGVSITASGAPGGGTAAESPGDKTPSPDGKAGGGQNEIKQAGQPTQPQFLRRDQFQQVRDIREDIRKAIIENQLDDRHDIDTNTLYAFKFDATVFTPGQDTSAWANVEIMVSAPDFEHIDVVWLQSSIFDQWIKYLKQVANDDYRDRLSLLYAKTEGSDGVGPATSAQKALKGPATSARKALKGPATSARKALKGPEWSARKTLKKNLYDFAVYNSGILTSEEVEATEEDIKEKAHELAQKSGSDGEPLDCLDLSPAEVDCLLNDFIARMIRFSKFEGIRGPFDRNRAINFLIAKWVQFDVIHRPELDDFVSVRIVSVDPVNFKLEIREQQEKPQVAEEGRVETASLDQGVKAFEPVPLGEEERGEAGAELSGFEQFKNLFLTRGTNVFTYAVSPKVAAETLKLDVLNAHLNQLGLSLGLSNSKVDMAARLNALREQTTRVSSLLRKPIIVGYANYTNGKPRRYGRDGEAPANVPGSASETGADQPAASPTLMQKERQSQPGRRMERGEVRRGAVFGWLIGPRFQDEKRSRHVPTHVALSALVSLPTAWPEVTITMKTRWIDEDGKTPKGFPPRTNQYQVQLPVDYEKLTFAAARANQSAFGVAPQVFESRLDDIKLHVGRCADILIPGRNLWRSAIVTVGAQRSESIIVLPDMQGIIAHFDPIRTPPAFKSGETKANVRVWTSSGTVELTKPATFYDRTSAHNAQAQARENPEEGGCPQNRKR